MKPTLQKINRRVVLQLEDDYDNYKESNDLNLNEVLKDIELETNSFDENFFNLFEDER